MQRSSSTLCDHRVGAGSSRRSCGVGRAVGYRWNREYSLSAVVLLLDDPHNI